MASKTATLTAITTKKNFPILYLPQIFSTQCSRNGSPLIANAAVAICNRRQSYERPAGVGGPFGTFVHRDQIATP